ANQCRKIPESARFHCRQALDVCASVRVMRMEKNHDKVEGKEPKPKKPPGFRKFKKLLKRVVNAPPLRKPATK
ncbi:MAG: hypothetical protein WAK22_08190, partial [Candidatus Sulfotelmatobacter sp.]